MPVMKPFTSKTVSSLVSQIQSIFCGMQRHRAKQSSVITIAAGIAFMSACHNTVRAATPLVITEKELTIIGDLGTFRASWQSQQPEANLLLATLTLTAPQDATPPPLEVKFNFPAIDLAGVWVSDYSAAFFDHQGVAVESRGVLRAPLVMLLGPDDGNRMTVALSDALRTAKINCGIKEEDVNMHASVKLFSDKQAPLKDYKITFRIDTRTQPYYKVLRDTAQWWANQPGYQPAPATNVARVPLYSTWYNYHQSVDPATIINECILGGKLGLEGVIVDDGWQTLDTNRGYAFAGDWKPERIPEMKRFVDSVHALNQKFMLWYAVPLAGEKSAAAKRFEGKMLSFSAGLGAHILDPRYPEVREYLMGIYENAVREWGVDGLKLDFIECFAPQPNTVLTAENGRDFALVDEAVDRLFTDIMARLRAIKPDIAIEFRQPYNGPLMRKYGNMLRAVDCPNAGPVNRKEIIDLRLIADHTAVHSDPIIWHPNEPVTSAALQILNVLFSVPQLSVRLGEVSPDHRKMIGFWMHYWKENRATLLDGELQPIAPTANYPLVLSRTPEKLVAAIYQDMVVALGPQATPQIDIVNAKPSKSVILKFEKAFGPAKVLIRDCMGTQISEQKLILGDGVQMWELPPSGLLEIRRAK
jgi:alpha-galactosidase